ncbi:hypothetical protein PLESTB_001481100 [Pleodorina starrii]|uniref:CRAL-TRIO domain-containing protein n=1 Tax=Pleodorina starrii TaxID=330485 RepID=A0A9W6BWY6_9CHLO|nr:hypothetical protein PLESTM_000652600 [Pleodorina starrii]GLC59390.1 hypothetical protein PLESTB_001481100 [Pleodorina starrii]GLC74411.1 hypothetical protein PLESTF_001510200 [Pleodorina starrii]
MAPRVPPPTEVLKFDGPKEFPIEQKVDDWGLTPEQQETYVELFRRRLAVENLWNPDDQDFYMLRRFLRARTYDIDKATKMFHDHMHWRKDHHVDTILQDFYFTERDKFLAAYPQGYHKLDKQGRPVYIQLIGKINVPAIMECTDEERMFKFHVQEYERCVKVIMPVCSKLANRKIDQTFGIMDVRGVGLSALTGEVKRMLMKFTKTDQDNYPEMLGHICIINAPAIFRMVWTVVKGMIDVRTQQKIEILGPNYMDALLKHMDRDAIPAFLGGESRGTLLDDVGPWSDAELMARVGIDLAALRLGHHAAQQQLTLPPAASLERPSADGGFLTPQGSLVASRSSGSGVMTHPAEAGNGASPGAAQVAIAQFTAVAEARSRTLIERVKAVEALLPSPPERQRTPVQTARDGVSVRSAPEGSLLNRVEVVEEALDVLLGAQEVLLAQTAAQAAEIRTLKEGQARLQQQAAQAAKQGCCTIM